MGTSAISRRDFLRIGGGAGAGLFFIGQIGGQLFEMPVAAAAIPGGTLDPRCVPKYATPLLIPPVMPRAGTITMPGGKPVDYYEISVRQFAEQILPAGFRPPTTVWGYGAVTAQSSKGLMIHNAPSLTIEAQYNRPVRVKWINELVDDAGHFLPHLLPVDPTLHWANPPGGTAAVTHDRPSPRRPAGTPARCRWSRTRTARSASATRATATPRRGTCRPPTTSRPASPPRARGTTSSRPRRRRATARRGARVRHVPVPEPRSGRDDLVPRPRPRHDPAQRVRRAGRLLHHPRRSRRRRRRARQPHRSQGLVPRAGAPRRRQVPAQQALPGDPHRHPGPVVQRRRVALLPGHPGLLRRDHGPLHPRDGHLADLEPRVLRQHDHGQRQHVAVPDRRAAPLPVPGPQRLPVALPHPRLRQHPRRRGVGDRQRGRLPRRPGQPHRDQREPAPHGAGRAGRPDRRLHQRAGGQLRARQRRPRRAVRRRRARRGLRRRRPGHDRPGHAVPGRARRRPSTPRPRPGSSSCRPSPPCRRPRSPGRWPCSRRCRRSSRTPPPRPCWARWTAIRTSRPACG